MAGKCPAISSARSGLPSLELARAGYHLTTFGHSTDDDHRCQPTPEPRPSNERSSHRDAGWWRSPILCPPKGSSESHLVIARPIARFFPHLTVAKIEPMARPELTPLL